MRNMGQRLGGPRAGWLLCVVVAVLALAGCGAGSPTSSAPANFAPNHSAGGATASDGSGATGAPAATPAPGQQGAGQQNLGPSAYLIKTLRVHMSVPDPRQAAGDLQQWITTTDPRAVSAGAMYQRQDNGTYVVQMSYSVQAALYPQVESYLAGYAASHKGHLDGLNESVQDVSNEYVDLQSRLLNLRTEQQRLLGLLAHATNLSDTLAIEDRLTQVEGEIELIEGRQNQLNGQLAYYTVTISLGPLSEGTKAPDRPFDPVGIFQGALSAAITFGQWLLAVIIWLAVFAVYALPVLAVIWYVRRRQRTRKAAPTNS